MTAKTDGPLGLASNEGLGVSPQTASLPVDYGGMTVDNLHEAMRAAGFVHGFVDFSAGYNGAAYFLNPTRPWTETVQVPATEQSMRAWLLANAPNV